MLKKLTYLTYSLTLGLLLVQIWISAWRATDGDRLAAMETETAVLQAENQKYQAEIYSLTSLENISRYIAVADMHPAEIVNLSSVIVALNRQ